VIVQFTSCSEGEPALYLYISSVFISNFLSGEQKILPTNFTVCCTHADVASYNTLVRIFTQTNHTSAGAMYAGSSVASCDYGMFP